MHTPLLKDNHRVKAFQLLVFTCFFSAHCGAQLCSGSYGDPLLNITFGTKAHEQRPHGTTLQYTGSCPSKEQYTLKNLVIGCGDNRSWLTLAGDHTLDQGGNYMLVDGEDHANAVHTDTIAGLCQGVRYVYSAWITNVMRPFSCGGHPQLTSLTFSVRSLTGDTLGSYNTGNIPTAQDKSWKQYGLAFQLPQGINTIVLSIAIDEKKGCGSGFAIDDITLRPCGVDVTATINGSAGDLKICADDNTSYTLQGSYGGGLVDPVVQWQSSADTGRTWNHIPAATTGTYLMPRRNSGVLLYRLLVAERANIQSPACRFTSNAIWTQVFPAPVHRPPQTLLGCLGKDLFLPQPDPKADSNSWRGPNNYASTSRNAVVRNVQYSDTGLYTMKESFSFGCSSLDSFYLDVYPATTISTQTLYSVCEGETIHLSASGDGRFHWEPATGLSDPDLADPVLVARDTTEYKVTVTNSFGCKDSSRVLVNVFRKPAAFAGNDKTIVIGDTVMLKGVVRGTATSFIWSPASFMDDPHSLTPKVAPPANTQYRLTVSSNVGCGVAEAIVQVLVYKDIFIPNAFTPNGDGKNDHFRVIAADGYTVRRFQVFNRWGQVVYSASGSDGGWNGNYKNVPQATGSYVYFLELLAPSGKLITRQGTVTLFR